MRPGSRRRTLLLVGLAATAATWLALGARRTLTGAGTLGAGRAVPLEQLLSEHWGDSWPEKRAELVAAGIDLQAPTTDSELQGAPRIEEVHQHLLESLRASREAWIDSLIAVDDDHFARTTSEAITPQEEELRAELLALAMNAFELWLQAERDLLERGAYQLDYIVPIEHVQSAPSTGALSTRRVWAEHPWYLTYALDSAAYPALDSVLREIVERKADLQRLLARH